MLGIGWHSFHVVCACVYSRVPSRAGGIDSHQNLRALGQAQGTRLQRHGTQVRSHDGGALQIQPHRHAVQREVNRTALAQLAVRAAVSRRSGRQLDGDEQLITLELLVVDAIGQPQLIDGQHAFAARRGDAQLRVHAHQRRCRVVAGRCDALGSAFDYVALGAVLLEAEAQGLAPEVRLVDPLAARVEQHIAAQRAHVTQLWSRDQ